MQVIYKHIAYKGFELSQLLVSVGCLVNIMDYCN